MKPDSSPTIVLPLTGQRLHFVCDFSLFFQFSRKYCFIFRAMKIESKVMIKNRYNYPTPSVQDTKGKEGRTLKQRHHNQNTTNRKPNNWPNGYPKIKNNLQDIHAYNDRKRKPQQKHRLGTVSRINIKKIAFGNKEHTTDQKMGVSVLLRLFISSNEKQKGRQ